MKRFKNLIISLFITFIFSPSVFAQAGVKTELGEVSNFGELTSLVWAYGSKVLIVLAIFFIVLGAFFYIGSGGEEERVTDGKKMIFGSLITILIVLFSGVLIRTLHQPARNTSGLLSEVPEVIGNATNILISFIGAFSLIMFIYSAFIYFTAQGNQAQIQKAHKSLKYAIYGVITGSLAYAIVNLVVHFFT